MAESRVVQSTQIHILPATAERWADLERLFGDNGACGGCWCMWWRQSYRDYQANKGEPNRQMLKALIERQGPAPGLLAYATDETGELLPAGWVAVAPRRDYPRLATSKTAKPVDELPVWSIGCLFIARPFRRRGLSSALIDAAARYAFEHGAPAAEGYPHEPQQATSGAFIWTGVASAYLKAGFREVARHTPSRPVMRRLGD